ncbi:MAG: preprotein translocase subunit SecY [Planctomycetota bacterium]|jgi:preprotein translocase subunit SecY
MLGAFANIVRIPELRRKLLVTAALLVVYRLGIFIPCPGAYRADLGDLGDSGFFNLVDMFAGGALRMRSILGLGIMPYISASIIFQLMAAVVPALQKIAKEGEVGRKRINQYTRYATILLCLVQGFMMARWELVRGPSPKMGGSDEAFGYAHPLAYHFLVIASLTAGTMFLMWLGEQIDEFGIGSGISLIIMAGILARMPTAVAEIYTNFEPQLGVAEQGKIGPETVVILVGLFVFMVLAVVALTQAHRRVPIHTARTRTREGFSHRSYVPLRLNMSGVISIIFAQALMQVLDFLTSKTGLSGVPVLGTVLGFLGRDGFIYVTFFALLIVFFSYFYTAVTFNPVEQANNFKEWGTFIPGIRPGRHTAEYLDGIMRKVTLVGSITLVYVAFAPKVITWVLKVSPTVGQFFGGTGLLIVVGVALDLSQRMDQYLLMQHYQGFLDGGKMRGRR